jgi:hypothetical protein
MLRLLRRPSLRPTQATRRARLSLEPLERRDAPATLTLSVTSLDGKNVNLSGTLGGVSNPSMQTISISGQAMSTTSTNSQGQYSVNVQAQGLGTVTATSQDGSGATATAALTDVTPSLTLSGHEYSNHSWEFYGDVTYPGHSLQALKITFGGTPVSVTGQTTMTDFNGHYDVWVWLNGTSSDNGSLTAKVTTPWGTESDLATFAIYQSGT